MHIAKNGWVSNSKKGLNVTDFINTFAIKGILWLSIFNLIMYDFLWSAGPEWYCLSWVMAGLLFSLGWLIEFPPPTSSLYLQINGGGGGGFSPLSRSHFGSWGIRLTLFWSSTQLENQESLEIRFFLLPNMNAITTLSTLFTNLVRFPSFLYTYL